MAKYATLPTGETIAVPEPTEADVKALETIQGGERARDFDQSIAQEMHRARLAAKAEQAPWYQAAAEGALDTLTFGAGNALAAEIASNQEAELWGKNASLIKRDFASQMETRRGTGAYVAGAAAGLVPGLFLGGPVEAVGTLAEQAAARAIPQATSLAGKMLAKGATMAARGAAEGAIIQTSMDASRAVLHDNPITVDSLLASAGHGALWGAGIGGTVGIAAEGAAAAASKLAERYKPGAQVSKVLDGLGVSERRVQELTERAGGSEQLYSQIKTVMEEGGTTTVKDLLKNAKQASVNLSKTVTAAAKEANTVGVDWASVKGRLGERMVAEGASVPKVQAMAEAQIAKITDFESFVSVRDKLMASKSPVVRNVASMIDGEVRGALEGAASAAGRPEVADKLFGSMAAKATADSLAQAALNTERVAKNAGGIMANIGFGDAGLAAGALASGHPIAAAAAMGRGIVTSEIGRAVNNAVFDMGIAGKLDAYVNKTQELLRNSASKFLRPNLTARTVFTGNVSDYEKAREEFSRLAAPPARMALSDNIAPVARVNPGLAANMVKSRDKAVDYLSKLAPPDRSMAGSVSILQQPKATSLDMAEHAWLRAWKAVTDPQSVIKGIGDGTASKDEVAALREVYPALYQDLLKNVMSGVAEAKASGKGFGMNKVVELGILMDAPVDSTLRPEYVQLIQSYHEAMGQAQQQAQPPPPGGSSLSKTTLPKSQKMEM